jgi:hypothetical protein
VIERKRDAAMQLDCDRDLPVASVIEMLFVMPFNDLDKLHSSL